ncbi:hypothetical protein AAVH_38753, partial [Aphelenchoides avenae]
HDEDYHRPDCVDGFLVTASGYKKSERRLANGDKFSPCAKLAVLRHLRRVELSKELFKWVRSADTSGIFPGAAAKSHQDEWDEDWDEADAERQEILHRKAEL